jgi:hypothetical protein
MLLILDSFILSAYFGIKTSMYFDMKCLIGITTVDIEVPRVGYILTSNPESFPKATKMVPLFDHSGVFLRSEKWLASIEFQRIEINPSMPTKHVRTYKVRFSTDFDEWGVILW